MAIEYRFLDRGDDELLEGAALPTEGGIAVAAFTTGYDAGSDEVVALSIADLDGNVLFSQKAKPQNVADWRAGDASGGLAPGDVKGAPELYQFEDEISALFENATVVVAMHAGFVHEAIEASWVSLPDAPEVDLSERFRASHCAADYPGEPAAVATLGGIAAYYGAPCDEDGADGIARTVAACYRALVAEHVAERDAKGAEHWAEHERRLEEAERGDERAQAAKRVQAIKSTRINALLWLCAAAVFSNLAVQLGVRGFDFGFVAIAAAAAVFFAVRWALCLHAIWKLRKQG